jgi:hypothetical protein
MEKGIDLRSLNNDVHRARDRGSILDSKGQEFDHDKYELARVGKKQVLKVRSLYWRGFLRLTDVASLWTGEHDGALVRLDVYLGKSIGVSLINIWRNSPLTSAAYLQLDSRSEL